MASHQRHIYHNPDIRRTGHRRRYCPLRAKDPERRAKAERAAMREAAGREATRLVLATADYLRKRSAKAQAREAVRAAEARRGFVRYRGPLPRLNDPGVREAARRRLLGLPEAARRRTGIPDPRRLFGGR